jgi:hypothetical protein
MRRTVLLVAAGLTLVAACAKKPAAAPANAAPANAAAPVSAPAVAPAVPPGAAVSGVFTGDGRPATLTQVTAHPDDPFDGQAVTAIVLTAKDQGGDPKAAMGALFGNYGEAIVARIEADGSLVGTDVVHPGLGTGSTSLSGVIVLENYSNANGQLSGRLTTNGDQDVFGHKLNVDLTFHTKAP